MASGPGGHERGGRCAFRGAAAGREAGAEARPHVTEIRGSTTSAFGMRRLRREDRERRRDAEVRPAGRDRAGRLRHPVPLLRRVHEAQRLLREGRGDPGEPEVAEGQGATGSRAREASRAHPRGELARLAEAALADCRAFPAGTPIRCRSSTNNEDLAGLQRRRSVRLVHAPPRRGRPRQDRSSRCGRALWNFRAFEEREFYRIDHLATAMGVLVHPNFRTTSAPTASP